MLTLDEMKERKKQLGYTYTIISQLSGVPVGTVQKVFGGISRAPRRKTLEDLSRAFEEGDDNPRGSSDQTAERGTILSARQSEGTSEKAETHSGISERKQGEYTLDDYLALPDERRMEMIDGVFYDMSAPRTDHQMIAGQIYSQLLAFISSHKGSCVPFIAPADVQLDCDDKTIVQPDVFVICDRDRILGPRIFGAPDLITEVLSPSTKKKDMYLKLYKYRNAGVREYWIVDPVKEAVIVYDFEHDDTVSLYHFSDMIPVGIYHGECKINFPLIRDYISFLKNR